MKGGERFIDPLPQKFDLASVPAAVVERLPIYARALASLEEQGCSCIKSHELGEVLSLHPEQVRRDLSYFGHLGKTGVGYDISRLATTLSEALGLGRHWRTVLAGVGNLGRAILANKEFHDRGFWFVAAFDTALKPGAASISGVPVFALAGLARYLRASPAEIAVVAVPPVQAQAATDALVNGGVRAILNYAPVVVHVPEGVLVRNIDPVASLQEMAFYLVRAPSEEMAQPALATS